MERGPEEQRLIDRLKDCNGFHVWWTPEAANLTPEERAKELNDALDQVDAGHSKVLEFGDSRRAPMSGQPTVDVRELVANLGKDKP